MYLVDILRRAARSLFGAKVRTLLTALAIAVGAFALTLTLAATNGARDYANLLIKSNFDPSELIVARDQNLFNQATDNAPQEYNPNSGTVTTERGAGRQVAMLTDTDLAHIRGISGVGSVTPDLSVNLQYITRDGMRKYAGTAVAYNSYRNPELLSGNIPHTIPADGMILPEGFLQPLGFTSASQAIGQTVRVSVQKSFDIQSVLSSLAAGGSAGAPAESNSQETKFTILAVTKKPSTLIQPGTALNLEMSQSAVESLNDYATSGTQNYHKYLMAYAKVNGGTDKKTLVSAEKRIQNLGYSVQSVIDTEKTLTQVTSVLQGIVSVFGLIAVVASVFGVVNTMYISVLQRTREIGLMKALGMHKRDIRNIFRIEAALIGFIGGTLGSALAIGLGTLLNPWISQKLSLGSNHLLVFSMGEVAILILALTFIAMLAGLLPARKASRLDPIAALRTE